MAIDFIARAAAASAQAAADAATAGPASPVGLFTDLPLVPVDAAVRTIVTSGYAVAGAGAGIYVSDGLATAALAAAHPLFCRASSNGRHFRLLPDDNGLIPVACGGANGQETAITDTSPDARPAIQAAEYYRHAIGAKGVRLDARNYAIRRVPRTDLTSWDVRFIDYEGVPIVVLSSSVFKSTHPEGSLLLRRKADGTTYTMSDYQTLTVDGIGAVIWRGGMFFVEGHGQAGDPDPGASVGSFTLEDVQLDGGLRLARDGLIFEVMDKGIWQSNDRYCGHLTLKGKSAIIGFTSELIYTAGISPSIADRVLAIGPEVVLGETGGSCINANGQTTQIARCLCYNAYIGIEGWTGHAGGYLKAHFRDITHDSSIQGGIYALPPANYYEPTAPVSGQLPVGHLDIVLERSPMSVGSWLEGRIVAIDCTPSVGRAATFAKGAEMVDLEIVSIADRTNPLGAVSFPGGPSGEMLIRNVSVRAEIKRTAYATANGLRHAAAVYTFGSIGPNVVVTLGAQEGLGGHINVAAAAYDHVIALRGYIYNETNATGSGYFDCEANNGGTIPNVPVIALSCSGSASGVKNINLPTSNVTVGTRIYIANFTRNFVSPGLDVKVNGSNFRTGADEHIAGNYTAACFEFSGSSWRVVERL
ncbi:hypothetical protein H7F51_02825 [Novosphingobium flavum]|uniref:Uncharacterized protein n=1 Tax=Novosphingobium flavum TaxID=1778672 RepID=A0A7X1FPF2_9SPHN|nr:hypothetical protein [Novosphingobium flavum]MBC2664448.1 hypothetical protein [Novosphingobium flavum]